MASEVGVVDEAFMLSYERRDWEANDRTPLLSSLVIDSDEDDDDDFLLCRLEMTIDEQLCIGKRVVYVMKMQTRVHTTARSHAP